jgi:glyoxylase-like metal-dependent hydrolase (beta-lactamase superfamily II)
MDDERYRFQVGTFECMAVSDGVLASSRPPGDWFPDVPKERLERVLRDYGHQQDTLNCLVINTGDHLLLADTGMGAGAAPGTGKLAQNLRAAGIEPQDIDVVIITHGHGDHIGGSVGDEGEPTFPNARYVMRREEWDFWTSEANLAQMDEERSSFVRAKFLPLQDQLDLIDQEVKVLPGIRAIPALGHTPGHMAVVVSSGSEQLLYLSDAVIFPFQLEHPDWYPIFDLAPEQAAATRRRLLEWAAAEKALVLAFHLPLPGLGYAVQKEDAWQWQPIHAHCK